MKAWDVNRHMVIVDIALNDLGFVLLKRIWMRKGVLGGIRAQHSILPARLKHTCQRSIHLQVWTASHLSCEMWMGTLETSSSPRRHLGKLHLRYI